jgi:hypothetical protein
MIFVVYKGILDSRSLRVKIGEAFRKKNYRCSLGHLSKAFLIANEYRQTKIVVVCGDIFQNTPVVAKVLKKYILSMCLN